MENKIDVKSRNGVIVFLIILVLLFASLFAATSVYIIRCKKGKNNDNNAIARTTESFKTLYGVYVGELNVPDGTYSNNEKTVRLYVYTDGSFRYFQEPGIATCTVGYCTFDDSEFVLHSIVGCANDPGRTIINETTTLKRNSDESFTDSKLNVTLKRTTDGFENKNNIISTELKNALDNHFLD